MKKFLAILICAVMCITFLTSCQLVHTTLNVGEHTYEYIQYETGHFKQYTCGCPSPEIMGMHYDNDENDICDACGFEYKECNHEWDEGVEIDGGVGAYVMEYTCLLCGDKKSETITIIPE